MTLILSVRTPSGVVIAGDSFMTLKQPATLRAAVDLACSVCEATQKVSTSITTLPICHNNLKNCQKIFQLGDFCFGCTGSGHICGRPLEYWVRLWFSNQEKPSVPMSLPDAKSQIVNVIHSKILEEQRSRGKSLEDLADDWVALQLHISGYYDSAPCTFVTNIGKGFNGEFFRGNGVSVGGNSEIVDLFFDFYKKTDTVPPFMHFSLQDGVEYAESLMRSTSDFHRFGSNVPKVGGEIDIAVITPHDGFRWVKQKQVYSRLSPRGSRSYRFMKKLKLIP